MSGHSHLSEPLETRERVYVFINLWPTLRPLSFSSHMFTSIWYKVLSNQLSNQKFDSSLKLDQLCVHNVREKTLKDQCKKLRAILLLEVDFNDLHKIVFNTRVLSQLKVHQLMPKEIIAGRTSQSAIQLATCKTNIRHINSEEDCNSGNQRRCL